MRESGACVIVCERQRAFGDGGGVCDCLCLCVCIYVKCVRLCVTDRFSVCMCACALVCVVRLCVWGIFCMFAFRYVVVMMIDEWICGALFTRYIMYTCPVARMHMTAILDSTSPSSAASEKRSSNILFVCLHTDILAQNHARERQVTLSVRRSCP